ncbi:energy-coupling factor ABC transporter ATP-binding protein [Desulfocicer niacini]
MPNTSIYTLNNIRQSYNGKIALDIPRLSISPGSITGLMGPNGSGKSTLLKLLAFVVPPVRGEILFLGRPELPFSSGVRFNVTLLTQTPYLLKRSVYDNITHGLKIRGKAHGVKDPDVREQVSSVMAEVGLSFDDFAHRMDYELSGGEAQRVAMAARLILKPRVLLLDEPTASVDVNSATLIRRAALYARKTWGTTIVIASHDREWLQGSCDSLFQLCQGKLFQAGSKNIIPGPFDQDDQGFFHTLQATQTHQPIRVSPPPHNNASAVLDAHHMHLHVVENPTTKASTATGIIQGEILRLLGDKKHGHIIATIRVNDLDFTIRLTRDAVIQKQLLPGTWVILTYDLDNIEWI